MPTTVISHEFEPERAFFEKVDRILTGNTSIQVCSPISSNTNFLAYQKGNKIYLDFAIINGKNPDYFDFLKTAKGVNYHELAHWIFTDYKAVDFSKHPDPRQLMKVMNMMEDSRVESLFSMIYSKAALYFKQAAVKLIKPDFPTCFILFYGRRVFLPGGIVRYSEKLFKTAFGKAKTDGAKEIMDNFLKSTSKDKRLKLAKEMLELLNEANKAANHVGSGSNSIQEVSDSNSAINSPHGRKIKRDEAIKKLGNAMKENDKDDKKDSDSHGKKGAEDSQKDETTPKDEGELQEIIEAVLEEIDEDINKDLSSDVVSIKQAGKNVGFDAVDGREEPLHVNGIHKSTAENLSRMFGKLKLEMSEHYVPNKKHGRLNIRRAMMFEKNGKMDIFRQWKPSRLDEVKLASVILIDRSSSMSHVLEKVYGSAWCINKALTKFKMGHTSIATFDTVNKVIKSFRQKKCNWKLNYGGGTDPFQSLVFAQKELYDAKKKGIKTRILMMITDGEWDSYSRSNNSSTGIMRRLINDGVKILLVFYDNNSVPNERYLAYFKDKPHTELVRVNDIAQLPVQMKKFIRNIEIETRRRLGG
jgi:hypothetical protein